MDNKQFQQTANILCHIFCGLKLMESCRRLVDLGTGTLVIDATSAACQFDGRAIDALPIAVELNEYLKYSLTINSFDRSNVRRAQLLASIRLSQINSSERFTQELHVDSANTLIQAGTFHRLTISCQSEIAVGNALYRSKQNVVKEIPP